MPTLRARLLAQLEADEGYRQHPYGDGAGNLTVGFGRNLTDVGISEAEARILLANDLDAAVDAVAARWPWTGTLPEARQAVLLNMAVNLGAPRLAGFTRMWAALRDGDPDRAAREMLDSLWARQVGARAVRLADQMRRGAWG
jgi:lysozyme